MNNTLLALVVGLLAGAVGAFLPTLLSSGEREATPQTSDLDLRTILDRLDRLERRLEERHTPPVLRGTTPAARPDSHEALLAVIDERIRHATRQAAHAAPPLPVLREPSEPPPPEPAPSVELEMTLAEAARDLELTSHEEAEVRRIYELLAEQMIETLASDYDGGVAQVHRDLEDAASSPAKRSAITRKYEARMMAKLGQLLMLQGLHESRLEELLGEEKARRIEAEYTLTDVYPYDLELLFAD